MPFFTPSSAFSPSATWQSKTASRAANTVYQNTSAYSIAVSVNVTVSGGGGMTLFVENNASPSVQVALSAMDGANACTQQLFAIVPPGHYYKISSGSFASWMELS